MSEHTKERQVTHISPWRPTLPATGSVDVPKARLEIFEHEGVEAPAEAERAVPTRPPLSPRVVKNTLMVADLAAFLIGVVGAFLFQLVVKPVPRFVASDHLMLVAASLPVFAIAAFANRLYTARANDRRLEEAMNVVKTVALGMGGLLFIAFAVQYVDLSRLWVGLVGACVTLSLFTERKFARAMFRRLRSEGRLRRRIIMVGTDAHAINLMGEYERNPTLGYEVVGLVGDDRPGAGGGGVDVLGGLDELSSLLHELNCVGVVISLASIRSHDVNVLTRRLTDQGFHVALSSSLHDIDVGRLRPQSFDGSTMIYVERTIRHGWRGVAKRTFDVTLASALLLVTFPVLVASAIAIKATSAGPVFFRQVRVGKDGELFEVVKLRTMVTNAEELRSALEDQNESDGPLFKMRNDPRVTRVGTLLRKLSIDELPQLFCVILGSMSMVGPRPALPSEVEQWDEHVRERLRVMPGLTGMWQVSGRSDSSFEVYKRMDLRYVDNWSLWHDLDICIKTVRVVLTGKGAS